MEHVTGLKCTICGKVYKPSEQDYNCPADGGILDVEYNYDLVLKRLKETKANASLYNDAMGMWRYYSMMPVPYGGDIKTIMPPLVAGNTPLMRNAKLESEFGIAKIYIKDDGRNPTGSLKDRASSLLAVKTILEKRGVITTASTGNAAAALSGICASMGISPVIFVPKNCPIAKRTQMLVYGATLVLVDGVYDDAFDTCLVASKKYGWYCRNTGYNPYTSEGKKTVSYEICEQIANLENNFATARTNDLSFTAPDVLLVSVGDGNIVSGVHKGFKDLFAMGLIKKVPKILGIQSTKSASIYNVWKNKVDLKTTKLEPINADTIADSISAGVPRDPIRAANAASETGGAYILVTDEEIVAAIPEMAKYTGVFAEPAGATAYAGFKKAVAEGIIAKTDSVCILSTGSGLKDINCAMKSVEGKTSFTCKPSDEADLAKIKAAL